MALNEQTDPHVVFDALFHGSKKDVKPPIIGGSWREESRLRLHDPSDIDMVTHIIIPVL